MGNKTRIKGHSNTGYAVGARGTILKTTNGGLVSAAETKSLESTFTVSPNPASNKIIIVTTNNLPRETTVCVFNISSTQLQLDKFSSLNLIELDVSTLTKDIYLVKIQTKKGIETKKLM